MTSGSDVKPAVESSAAWLAAGAALVATFALAIRATGGWSYTGGWSKQSVYDHVAFVLVVALLCGGLAMMSQQVVTRRVGAAIVSVAGLALSGTGVTAHRRWFTSGGFSNPAKNEDDVRLMALALAVATGVAAVAAVALVAVQWATRSNRDRLWSLLLAVATGVAVPLAFGDTGHFVTGVGAHALMYGMPWAMAVLLISTADRLTAAAASGLLAIHVAFVAFDDYPMIDINRSALGAFVAAAIAAVAWATRSRSSVGPEASLG